MSYFPFVYEGEKALFIIAGNPRAAGRLFRKSKNIHVLKGRYDTLNFESGIDIIFLDDWKNHPNCLDILEALHERNTLHVGTQKILVQKIRDLQTTTSVRPTSTVAL